MIDRDWLFIKLTPKQIVARLAAEHGLTFADLTGPARTRKVCHVRFAAMREVRARTKLSTTQIGALFNRDHTTVCHALGVLSSRTPSDLRQAEAA